MSISPKIKRIIGIMNKMLTPSHPQRWFLEVSASVPVDWRSRYCNVLRSYEQDTHVCEAISACKHEWRCLKIRAGNKFSRIMEKSPTRALNLHLSTRRRPYYRPSPLLWKLRKTFVSSSIENILQRANVFTYKVSPFVGGAISQSALDLPWDKGWARGPCRLLAEDAVSWPSHFRHTSTSNTET